MFAGLIAVMMTHDALVAAKSTTSCPGYKLIVLAPDPDVDYKMAYIGGDPRAFEKTKRSLVRMYSGHIQSTELAIKGAQQEPDDLADRKSHMKHKKIFDALESAEKTQREIIVMHQKTLDYFRTESRKVQNARDDYDLLFR